MALKTAKAIAIITGTESPHSLGRAILTTILKSPYQPLSIYATSPLGTHLHLTPTHHNTRIHYPKLDVTSPSSVQALVSLIRHEKEKEKGEESVVLINSAGVRSKENVRRILDVNYRGTLRMCQAILPLLGKGGRIVSLSSNPLALVPYNAEIQARLRDEKLTLRGLEDIAVEYEEAVKNGKEEEKGFGKPQPGMDYAISKACVNALTAILARENPGLAIKTCCPDWVDIEMEGRVREPLKRPEEVATIAVQLGFGEIEV